MRLNRTWGWKSGCVTRVLGLSGGSYAWFHIILWRRLYVHIHLPLMPIHRWNVYRTVWVPGPKGNGHMCDVFRLNPEQSNAKTLYNITRKAGRRRRSGQFPMPISRQLMPFLTIRPIDTISSVKNPDFSGPRRLLWGNPGHKNSHDCCPRATTCVKESVSYIVVRMT